VGRGKEEVAAGKENSPHTLDAQLFIAELGKVGRKKEEGGSGAAERKV
jgi:hypothetical protein